MKLQKLSIWHFKLHFASSSESRPQFQMVRRHIDIAWKHLKSTRPLSPCKYDTHPPPAGVYHISTAGRQSRPPTSALGGFDQTFMCLQLIFPYWSFYVTHFRKTAEYLSADCEAVSTKNPAVSVGRDIRFSLHKWWQYSLEFSVCTENSRFYWRWKISNCDALRKLCLPGTVHMNEWNNIPMGRKWAKYYPNWGNCDELAWMHAQK